MAFTRGAVSSSSQRMSCGVTKRQVGRGTRAQMAPRSNAASTLSSVAPATPSDGPFGAGVVLALAGQVPRHRLRRSPERLAHEPLRVQAPGYDVAAIAARAAMRSKQEVDAGRDHRVADTNRGCRRGHRT